MPKEFQVLLIIMASSNRHWPSMFKSKPFNPHHHHHHQWQHDINPSSLLSPACHRAPYTSVPGNEERSPEPKPRWNPKPEQIRILEAIFNSGMVNPPRDEIRKIRAQLQEFGQVGDANVFYWFQNRKSRSKHKLRHLQNSSKQQNNQITPPIINNITTPTTTLPAPSSSSSSSSEKSSPSKGPKKTAPSSTANIDLSTSPTGSVTQTYFQPHTITEFLPEPFFFSAHQTGTGGNLTQGFCFPELANMVQVQDHHDIAPGPCTSLLLSEIMMSTASKKDNQAVIKSMKMQQTPLTNYTAPSATSLAHAIGLAPPPPPPPHTTNHNSVTVTSTINHIHQGELGPTEEDSAAGGGARSSSSATVVVFINDMAFEIGAGPINVREAFGEDVLLIDTSGHPVLTNEWGVTLQSLHHGAFYYLIPLSIHQHM